MLLQQQAKKINYVGHSQGTTMMFAALSLQIPEVVNNIISFSALGPVTFVQNMTSSLTSLLMPITNLFPIFGSKYIFLNSITAGLVRSVMCLFFDTDCKLLLKAYSDHIVADDNTARLDYIANYFPSSTSTQNVFHWK
jgi:pimeloyl-ACP methyl ester carboxylesterase